MRRLIGSHIARGLGLLSLSALLSFIIGIIRGDKAGFDRFLLPLFSLFRILLHAKAHLIALTEPVHGLFVVFRSRHLIVADRQTHVARRVRRILPAHVQHAEQLDRFDAALVRGFLQEHQRLFMQAFRFRPVILDRLVIERLLL